METYKNLFLLTYFILVFTFTFVLKSIQVKRKTGRNPLVFPSVRSYQGRIGMGFRIVMALIFIYLLLLVIFPHATSFFVLIEALNRVIWQWIGLVLVLIGWSLIILAQVQMRNSWRIGIDTEQPGELITNGIFKRSRNPVFLGLNISLVGMWLASPTFFALGLVLLASLLMYLQILDEETFLAKHYGKEYFNYKQKVGRFL